MDHSYHGNLEVLRSPLINLKKSVPDNLGILHSYDDKVIKYLDKGVRLAILENQTNGLASRAPVTRPSQLNINRERYLSGTPISKAELLGAVGERLVAWYLDATLNCEIIQKRAFDVSGDLEIPGYSQTSLMNTHLTIEVKTQNIFNKNLAFTVEEDQFDKINNAGLTFFVSLPLIHDKVFYPGAIWLYKKRTENQRPNDIFTKGDRVSKILEIIRNFNLVHTFNVLEQNLMLLRFMRTDHLKDLYPENSYLIPKDKHFLSILQDRFGHSLTGEIDMGKNLLDMIKIYNDKFNFEYALDKSLNTVSIDFDSIVDIRKTISKRYPDFVYTQK